MAGKYGSADAIFLMDGYNLLAAKVKTLSLKITSITEQTDGLGDASEAMTPVGKQKSTLTQGGGLFDTAQNSMHAAIATNNFLVNNTLTPQSTVRTAVVGIMGNVLGAVMYGLKGVFSVAYEAVLDLGKLTKANAEYAQADLVERGALVQPLATKTADWNTHALGTPLDYATDWSQYTIPITSISLANPGVVTTPVPHGLTTGQRVLISGNTFASPNVNIEVVATVIDTLNFSLGIDTTAEPGGVPGTGGSFVRCSTVNGGGAYLQVTAFSGFTGFIGKIRHSADESTYADLATFANVTSGPTAQRVQVAGGATVNRYLVFDGDVTGTGSITVLAGFCRA